MKSNGKKILKADMHTTELTGGTQDNVHYYSEIFPKSSDDQSIFSHHIIMLL